MKNQEPKSNPEGVDEQQRESVLVVPFEKIPLGGRFRYPGSDRVWTVLTKYREEDGKRLFGTIAEWRPGMMKLGKWTGQSICSHLPGDQGGDCPEMVYAVDDSGKCHRCGTNGITRSVTTFAEWYESKIGITLEQAKRAGVYDLALLEEAFNFPPNAKGDSQPPANNL